MQERKSLSKNTVNLLLLIAVCFTGAIFGAIFSDSVRDDIIDNICALREYGLFREIISESFFKITLICLIFFLLGLSPVSFPFEIMLLFFIGQSFGSIACRIYDFKGILFSLGLFPSALICTASISLGVRESLRMSRAVYNRTFLTNEYTPADIKLYIKKFLIILFIGFMGSLTDALSAVLLK